MPKHDSEDILDDSFADHIDSQLSRRASLPDPVLAEIRDLMQKKARQDEEERARKKRDIKLKRDWALAALVVNRICFIFFTTTLVAVTLVFFIVFHLHH